MPAYRPQAGDEGADMAISAKELPLGKVFTPDFRFTIPSFQRAYIWKTENILQLVSDLDDACKSPGTPYFLGSLILVREGDNRYDVIDGQQRLVSLSIIIAVLRDLERDPDLMRQLDALLVEPGDKLRGIVTEPRLTLRERDAAFFREHVQEDNLESVFDMNDDDLATAAQRNIVANIRKTYDEISNWSASERQQFAQYLVNEVTLVIVTTDDLDGAHRIFDVMNMRGLPLTPSDVFKRAPRPACRPPNLTCTPPAGMTSLTRLATIRMTVRNSSPICISCSRTSGHRQAHRGFPGRRAATVHRQRHGAHVHQPGAGTRTRWRGRIIARPSDTVLPAEVRSRLEGLDDYRSHEWKPVAMWALVNSYRGLGDADLSPFVVRASRIARTTATLESLGAMTSVGCWKF